MTKVRTNGNTPTTPEQMAGEMDRGMTKRLNAAAMTGFDAPSMIEQPRLFVWLTAPV
jgi:hypothetical protein